MQRCELMRLENGDASDSASSVITIDAKAMLGSGC
jgi:hypothetical protein